MPLEPGANLIDVAASAEGRRPTSPSLRIVREQRVPLPDVVGGDADTAQDQLEGLGLDGAIGGRRRLLRPDPAGRPEGVRDAARAPGAQVLPGSEVTLLVARDC